MNMTYCNYYVNIRIFTELMLSSDYKGRDMSGML